MFAWKVPTTTQINHNRWFKKQTRRNEIKHVVAARARNGKKTKQIINKMEMYFLFLRFNAMTALCSSRIDIVRLHEHLHFAFAIKFYSWATTNINRSHNCRKCEQAKSYFTASQRLLRKRASEKRRQTVKWK